jgi:hypothetical protein
MVCLAFTKRKFIHSNLTFATRVQLMIKSTHFVITYIIILYVIISASDTNHICDYIMINPNFIHASDYNL